MTPFTSMSHIALSSKFFMNVWKDQETMDAMQYGINHEVPVVFFESRHPHTGASNIISHTPCGKIILTSGMPVNPGELYLCTLAQKDKVAFVRNIHINTCRDSYYWSCIGSDKLLYAIKHIKTKHSLPLKEASDFTRSDKKFYGDIARWLVRNDFIEEIIIISLSAISTSTPASQPAPPFNPINLKPIQRKKSITGLQDEVKRLRHKVEEVEEAKQKIDEAAKEAIAQRQQIEFDYGDLRRDHNIIENVNRSLKDTNKELEDQLIVACTKLLDAQGGSSISVLAGDIDIWEIIGCKPSTPKEDIIKAVRKARLLYHPDLVIRSGKIIQDIANTIITELNLFVKNL